jgi:hypothetical protein
LQYIVLFFVSTQSNFYMIKILPEKSEITLFFISLIGFAFVLPFSQALVSIFGGIVLIAALVEDSFKNKMARFKANKVLLFIPGIFIVYLLSFIVFYQSGNSLYDLQKTLFFLVIPFSFIVGKPLTCFQKRFLFYVFTMAVFFATIVALLNWFSSNHTTDFGVHKISLISHIRFSFQLILVFWFLVLLVQRNFKLLNIEIKVVFIFLALFLLGFLFFQQSLTGVVAFGASVLFYFVYNVFQIKSKSRGVLIAFLLALVLSPVLYVFLIVHSFYDIEKVDKEFIDKKTASGNYYSHDFDNLSVENGRYTYLYICDDEMRVEWNKISKIKYDDGMPSGYPMYTIIYRYLTSKGLRKDAEGIKSLTPKDIQNIEHGITNVIFQEKKYTLYPRIYQTVWEYYMYSITGNPSYQSFSQRLEYSKAAISIIKKHFWFGVGAGNWREEFKNTYIENNSKLKEGLYASSHNQFLNYMVKFGISGFMLIMFFIVYPIVKTVSYRDLLFLLFLVFLFFANFADSNFESHMGSSFFLFFYCLFIIQPNDLYLNMSDN